MNQTVTLTLDQCPQDIRDYFLADPGYQSAIRIVKTSKHDNGTPSIVEKTLKTGLRHVQKADMRPGFAEILGGSVSRDSGTPAPAIPTAPAPTTAPTEAVLSRSNLSTAPTVRQPMREAFNTPKEFMRPERGNSVEWKDLQEAMTNTMRQIRSEDAGREFNEKRSAFSRLAPTKASDVKGGGSGNAWSLRNMGGKLAASLLNGTVHKNDKPLPTNTGFRAVSGESLNR